MNKIKKLTYLDIQKIAAGEVIERPANVVKELVENALDAGATKIDIYIKGGGQDLVRVVDNGSGIAATDIELAFEQHATSKIASVDELSSLETLGFRGEALSSIAGVSKVTLITKDADQNDGICSVRKGGDVVEHKSVASAQGTDITIEDVFFNMPARKKFLKKADTEWRHIVHLFNAYCFSYPTVHFKIFSENRLIYNRPASVDLIQRAHMIWDTQPDLLGLEAIDNGIRLVGVISGPHYTRYDRSNLYFFVNKRLVKNYTLAQAVLKGYSPLMLPQQYPTVCISIELPADQIDVNIHPRKEEIQFLHPRRVEQVISNTIKERLQKYTTEKITTNPFQQSSYQPYEESGLFKNFHQKSETGPYAFGKALVTPQPILTLDRHLEHKQDISREPLLPVDQDEKDQMVVLSEQEVEFALIGQYHATYLLLEKEGNLVLVDQHAAHERILYERFKKNFGQVPTVALIFPHLITLSDNDINLVSPLLHQLQMHGVVTEVFGKNQIRIEATPIGIKYVAWEIFFKELIAWIVDHDALDIANISKALHEHVHAQMACKAAVKAGDILSNEQMRQLLDDLKGVANRFSCPHGRPTTWTISLHDIEKKFKRKL
jgi:DNA mismatch repair protein MutL